MKNISRRNIGGFTLVEILVVVLIIGILSAVAVPMYQGAVDKTHFSTMLSPTRTLKEAQEAVRMATGNYTTDTADLDVDLSQEALSYQIKTTANGDEFNVISATNDKLPNVRLSQYLDENVSYEGQRHCEAISGNERATRLCEKIMQGEKVFTTSDGYTSYLLESPCQGNSHYLASGQCGYEGTNGETVNSGEICLGTILGSQYWNNSCANSTVNEGGTCQALGKGDCRGSTINNGGTCDARYADDGSSCQHLKIEEGGLCLSDGKESCSRSTVKGTVECTNVSGFGSRKCGLFNTYDGGICVANVEDGCRAGTFKNGSICYANARNACGIYTQSDPGRSFDSTSCCCGAYCPSGVPKCEASRCDPQYMK